MGVVYSNRGNERGSFREHDKRMRIFRKYHPLAHGVKVSRRDLLYKMRLLLVLDTMLETGGTRGSAGTVALSVSIPIWKVTPARFLQN